jgi:hypothetical protein
VVSVTSLPRFTALGKDPWYPLYRRLNVKFDLLYCDAVLVCGWSPIFQRNELPPISLNPEVGAIHYFKTLVTNKP